MSMTSENVELRFCDLCGRSVPEKEFADGLTRKAGNKLVGACCLAPLGVGAQAPATSSGQAAPGQEGSKKSATGLALLGLGLGLAAILGSAAWLDFRMRARDNGTRIATIEGGLDSLRERVRKAEEGASADRAALPSRVEERMRAAFGKVDQGLADLGAALPKGDGGVTELKGMLNKLRQHVTELSARQGKVEAGLVSQSATLERELAVVARSLTDLRRASLASPSRAASPATAEVGDGEASASSKPQALPDKLGKHVDELGSTNAGVRWEAVDELLRSGDKRVVPYVLPCLKDDDPFVRRLVAESLPRAADIEVCGALIEAMADRESIVREAAHKSLVQLSRQNFPFDPEASEKARRAQIAKWASWWKKR